MTTISASSLMKLVQIVDRDIGDLRKILENNPTADLVAELEVYSNLAEELEIAYVEATEKLANYPEYGSLVSNRH